MGINGQDKQDVFDEYFNSENAVIIDGVDVSECNFRLIRDEKQMCECCHATGFGVICACEMWKDCPYKQLQRLKAENERLKKEIRLYDCIDRFGTKECHCACRCLGNEFCIDADKRINKYKQALEDIREIAYTTDFDIRDIQKICNEVLK